MGYCVYGIDEVDIWDDMTNAIGKGCSDCENYNCIHNPNDRDQIDEDIIIGENYVII